MIFTNGEIAICDDTATGEDTASPLQWAQIFFVGNAISWAMLTKSDSLNCDLSFQFPFMELFTKLVKTLASPCGRGAPVRRGSRAVGIPNFVPTS